MLEPPSGNRIHKSCGRKQEFSLVSSFVGCNENGLPLDIPLLYDNDHEPWSDCGHSQKVFADVTCLSLLKFLSILVVILYSLIAEKVFCALFLQSNQYSKEPFYTAFSRVAIEVRTLEVRY